MDTFSNREILDIPIEDLGKYMERPQFLSFISMGSSKAATLAMLEGKLSSAKVLPQFRFTVVQWQKDAVGLIKCFYEQCEWAQSTLVVRSSGAAEDSNECTLAGHYDSVLNVTGIDTLNSSITAVLSSFGEHNPDDQIFIQPMLVDVAISGVVFTKEPSTHSPYYVINYSQSGSTESVTSGSLNEELIYVAKCHSGNAQS